MHEYLITACLTTEDSARTIRKRFAEFLAQYEEGLVLSIENYPTDDSPNEPSPPDSRTWQYENYPGHPL